jgi:acetyl-CoA acetyltransferase
MPQLADVLIYDAVRTPLGRGKSIGKLHTQTPVSLVSVLLRELSRRHPSVEQATDEVILGCFMERTKVPFERINVAGGAIAIGHPVGATGATLVGTLVNSMRQRNAQHGVVTMCTGLGMGVATVLERI